MSPALWLVTSCAGVLVLAVLAVVYRRAAAQRELELAEELLAEELAPLEAYAPRPAAGEARPSVRGSGTSPPPAS